jgi:hypothetical protein
MYEQPVRKERGLAVEPAHVLHLHVARGDGQKAARIHVARVRDEEEADAVGHPAWSTRHAVVHVAQETGGNVLRGRLHENAPELRRAGGLDLEWSVLADARELLEGGLDLLGAQRERGGRAAGRNDHERHEHGGSHLAREVGHPLQLPE